MFSVQGRKERCRVLPSLEAAAWDKVEGSGGKSGQGAGLGVQAGSGAKESECWSISQQAKHLS